MSTAGALGVRPAIEDDLGTVCAIVNHFIESTVCNFRTDPQTVDDWRRGWTRLHERFPWLVAADGDRVMGVAYASPWSERAAYRWTVETTIYVAADAHRRGIAHALYTDLLRRLRGQGSPQ